MKLSKFVTLFRKESRLSVYQDDNGLYVGNGCAFYRWDLTPQVDERLLREILGNPNLSLTMRGTNIDVFGAINEKDVRAELMKGEIKEGSHLICPVLYGEKVIFVQKRFLFVLGDRCFHDLYVRKCKNYHLVVDTNINGIILPIKLGKDRASEYQMLANALAKAIKGKDVMVV
jgi:hypothetical protein